MVDFGKPVNCDGDDCAATSVFTVCMPIQFAYIISRIMKHNQYLYASINISHLAHQVFQRQEMYLFLSYCSVGKLSSSNQKEPTNNEQPLSIHILSCHNISHIKKNKQQ